MFELLSMIRPFGKWHVLMAVFLLDLALILVKITDPGAGRLNEQRLQEVLAQNRALAQEVQERRSELEALMRAESLKADILRELTVGVDDLEDQIARLKVWAART